LTFGENILAFNRQLKYTGPLPAGIRIMNPFHDNKEVGCITQKFYSRYYNDQNKRKLILGINPGRFGAGLTGISFTDTVRLKEKCGIVFESFRSVETSSVFFYEMIDAYGGVEAFYKEFYVSAVCPLGFTVTNSRGKQVNYNYYDSRHLQQLVYPFITECIEKQLLFNIDTSVCYCLGTGKNEKFLRQLNDEKRYFGTIIALEHPRYIMQYKLNAKSLYIEKYLESLRKSII